MMNKLISYSLWGDDPRYVENIFRNFPAREKYYPDWEVKIFFTNVSDKILARLSSENCSLFDISKNKFHPMFARFLPADDIRYDAVIFRDADSILNYREKMAVEEWLNSDRPLHSMRDAGPHNMLFQGGMWGIRPKQQKASLIEWMNRLGQFAESKTYVHKSGYTWGDQSFLEAFTTTHYNKEDILAHDNQLRHSDVQCVKPFPSGERPRQHVGYAFVDHTEEIEKNPTEGKNHEMLVVMSCDDNPYYFDFWKPVSYVWKEIMGITPVLVHFGDKKPSDEHGIVIPMSIDSEIPVHTQCQLSRLWIPKVFENQYCMTSDIDMFPFSKQYWGAIRTNLANTFSTVDWVNLNSNGDYFPICYNIAKSETYADVLELEDNFYDFVKKVLKETKDNTTHDVGFGDMERWSIDEEYSSAKIVSRRKDLKIGQPERPGGFPDGHRIDRVRWTYDTQKIESGYYIDCHSVRPFKQHEKELMEMVRLI